MNKDTIKRHFGQFRHAMTAAGSVDAGVAEKALQRLYERAQLPPPAVIWCRSFYHMLTMPSLLIGILHSDVWELVAGNLTSRSTDKKWNKYWNNIWPEIWLNSGRPLLTGMNRTSGIYEQYVRFEDQLIAQAKSEFGKALHSGRLDRMQHTLNREMYRRFWAPHAREFARNLAESLKTDIASGLELVKDIHADWPYWDVLETQDAELATLGEGVSMLFTMLGNRLGGEPGAQAGFMMQLPADVPWLATAFLLNEIWPQQFQRYSEDLQMWLDIAANASAIMCLDGVVFVCEKPRSFYLDDRQRAHSADGPFLSYADGSAEFAWEGVVVPRFVVEAPLSITVELIESTKNAEVRRVMLERYGMERFVEDAGVEAIHEDEFGILYRREFSGDEALVLLRVVNSSPEPDGSFREYFLRVPPNITTARQAAAWTFGFEPHEYGPLVQT